MDGNITRGFCTNFQLDFVDWGVLQKLRFFSWPLLEKGYFISSTSKITNIYLPREYCVINTAENIMRDFESALVVVTLVVQFNICCKNLEYFIKARTSRYRTYLVRIQCLKFIQLQSKKSQWINYNLFRTSNN